MRPSERVGAACLVALAAAAILSRPPLAAAFAALAGAVVALTRLSARSPTWALARDLSPIAILPTVFMLLEPVIVAVNPRRWDAFFAALDDRHLPALVAAWRTVAGRPDALTDLVYAAYVSYYLLPVVVALAVRARASGSYEATAFPIVLSFWLSFLGYFLFPTEGPRLPRSAEAALLGGGAFSDGVRAFLHAAEATRLDAFPSGHTAVSIVSAAAGARVLRRWTAPLLAWAAAIVFATVYIHVHYAVDVVAGAALAAAVLAAAPALSRALGGVSPRGAATGTG
jgi:membrane-associated phospholipid phosphatase